MAHTGIPPSVFGKAEGGTSTEMDYLRRMVESMEQTGKTTLDGAYKELSLGSAMRIQLSTGGGFDAAAAWLRRFGFKEVKRAEWDEDSDDEDEEGPQAKGKIDEIALVAESASFILSSRPGAPVTLEYISDDLEGRLELLRRSGVPFVMHTDRECTKPLPEDRTKAVLAAVDERLAEKKAYALERRKQVAEHRKANAAAAKTDNGTFDAGSGEEKLEGDFTPFPWRGQGEDGEVESKEGGSTRRKLSPPRTFEPFIFPSILGLTLTAPGKLPVAIRRTRVAGTGMRTSPLPGYELDAFNEEDGAAFDASEAARKAAAASLTVGAWAALSSMYSALPCARRSAHAAGQPILGYEAEEELVTYAGVIVPLPSGGVGGVEVVESAIKWWKRLGFDMHSMDNEPQDYAIVSDGQVVLALLPEGHALCPSLPGPGLLYTTQDVGAVERHMKVCGLIRVGSRAVTDEVAQVPGVDTSGKKKTKKTTLKPQGDKKDDDSGRTSTIAVPFTHTPTSNRQGALVTCTIPGGLPVVLASNPESKTMLYLIAGCATMAIVLALFIAFALATSDSARRTLIKLVQGAGSSWSDAMKGLTEGLASAGNGGAQRARAANG